MMRVLVVGDLIIDQYHFGKTTRLCPEGPAPVLVDEVERTSMGGAGLVSENLKSLLGPENVIFCSGSVSHKYRYYSGHTLLLRRDKDAVSTVEHNGYWNEILRNLTSMDVIVVGDYGKGAITSEIASGLLNLGKPLFVDAKDGIEKYKGCFAVFPNEEEHRQLNPSDYQHIIRKLGPKGCSVDGILIPTEEEQQVYDVCGAGDVFLAAFVWKFIAEKLHGASDLDGLITAAHVANKAGGISVKHLGTYIVKPEELTIINGKSKAASEGR